MHYCKQLIKIDITLFRPFLIKVQRKRTSYILVLALKVYGKVTLREQNIYYIASKFQ